MEKLVILDFDVQDIEVHIYNISEDVEIDESFIEKLGHNPDYCQWAIGTKADVTRHKGLILK